VVHLTGTVTDEAPATVAVRFSGVVSDSTTARSDGSYDLVTLGSTLGTIFAQAQDQEGLVSAELQATISSDVPQLTLDRAYGPGGTVTLSGHVTDEDPIGRTVTFSGAVSGTATTNQNGDYSLTTQGWGLGDVQAVTTDPWHQQSDQPAVNLANAAPVITDFTATEGADRVWRFRGHVSDEYAPGLRVRLDGLPSLNKTGYTEVTVGSDGWFECCVQLGQGEQGTVRAWTTDWRGLASNTAATAVWQT
jgi:hypothetical protein